MKTHYVYAVVVAFLFSVFSAYYYLRIVRLMYMESSALELRGESALQNDMALGLCMILILVFGALPALMIYIL